MIYAEKRTSCNKPAASGGNLGGAGGGGGGGRPPPPHLHGKLTDFRKFWPKRGLKTVFSSANGGGGTSEIWKFCRKFRRLCLPTGNFRHCLQQTCSNAVPATCQQDVSPLLVPSLLTSCRRFVDKLSTTCYKLFQQLVIVLQFNNLSATCCEWQPCRNYKITALLQLVDKLATSLLRTHLVDKLWDSYVCMSVHSKSYQLDTCV
jgi:hypothetical protein